MAAKLTKQRLYNKVKRHLLTQMKKSMKLDGIDVCQYRTAEGLKCAIGCLIPKTKYRPEFEGKTIDPEIADSPIGRQICRAAGITKTTRQLAAELQYIHDSYEPYSWKHRLEETARTFGLRP